jgi:hypothetical protein
MRRALFTVLAALSLLLAITSITLWIRSYNPDPSIGARDSISFTHSDPLYWIISHPGSVVFCRQEGRNWDGHELRGFQWGGISFGGSWGDDGSMLWNLAVPFWMITTLALVLPAARAQAWRRDRRGRCREARGLCRRCGYDLRATPDRCPECGTAPSRARPQAVAIE